MSRPGRSSTDILLAGGSPQPATSAGGHKQTAENGLSWDTVHPSPRRITSSDSWPMGCPGPRAGG
eukprot:6862577-Pyramimonas_sp.AAC.1